MASAGLYFSNITPDNGAVREINRLVFKDVLQADRIGSLLNVFPRVFNGDKLDLVGEFGLLGKASTGCSPEYGNDTINTEEKTWALAAWQIAEQICWDDIKGTLVKYSMNTGTDIADLTANDYLDEIVVPRLELAIMKMYIRLAFFGDTSADTTANGGILKVGTDKTYFTLLNGIWKQIYTIVSGDATKRVTISANAELTKAAQISNMASQAVDTLNDMIAAASPALRQASDQIIYVTQSFADALETQLLASYYGSELHWQSLFGGIRETSYRGIRIRVIPMWDEIIQSYEGTTTAFNLPHRAIYTTERNLALGVNGFDEFATLDIFFDQTTRLNHIYATDQMGAMVIDSNMFVAAY